MISQIILQNFKVFKSETAFEFSKINLLTGVNGRGKSTLLQSMLLFKQTLDASKDAKTLLLNGSCVNLGTFQDIKNADTPNKEPICVTFILPDEEGILEYFFIENEEENGSLVISDFKLKVKSKRTQIVKDIKKEEAADFFINPTKSLRYGKKINIMEIVKILALMINENTEIEDEDADFFLNKIHYIGADRLGSQQYYEKISLPENVAVDKQGKNLASILVKKRNDIVAEALQINDKNYMGVSMYDTATTLITQLGNWIGYITDTPEVFVHIDNSNSYIISLEFEFGGKRFKPNNIGFGYSYILSIVLSGLIAKPGAIVIIENPEAHLHPRAQSRLAKFLAKVASTGVQIFVESHSEHVLNALRVCVKNGELQPEDTKIHYFTNDKLFTPHIDEDGRIDVWEDGFFDEWNNNLMELL